MPIKKFVTWRKLNANILKYSELELKHMLRDELKRKEAEPRTTIITRINQRLNQIKAEK